MIVDDEKYRIISKRENIYIVSEEGKAKIISEMIYNNDNSIKNHSNIEELIDTTSNINTYAYGKDYGPFYKTNKSLCKVLSVISITTKLFKWSHPALGTISFVCSAVSKVGDTFLKTMYIKFYQAFNTEKTNNVKETQHWYFDSNYQNLAIQNRHSLHSSRRPTMKNYKLGFYSINTLICIYTLYKIIIKSDFIIEARLFFSTFIIDASMSIQRF